VNTVGTIEKAFISESLLIYSRDIGISLTDTLEFPQLANAHCTFANAPAGISLLAKFPLVLFSNVVFLTHTHVS